MKKIVILVGCLLISEVILLGILPFLHQWFSQSNYTGILLLIPLIDGILMLVLALLYHTKKVIEQNSKEQSAKFRKELLEERQGSLKAEREELLGLIDTLQKGNDVLALPTESYQRYCPHPLTDAILRHKMIQFKKDGIDCAVTAAIPSTLNVKDTVLLAVLINLLDNAGQAVLDAIKTDPNISAKMSVKLFCRANHLVIKVENTALQRPTTGKSTKKNEGHGLGLAIIEQECRENGGSYLAEYNPDSHVCQSTAILHFNEVGLQ